MKRRLSKKERINLIRIICALIAFVVVLTVDKVVRLQSAIGGKYGFLLPFALYLAIYAAVGYDVIFKAVRNILRGQVFDENFLMMIASLGAFALAIYRGASGLETEGFDEACAVLLLYQIGEFFQRYATKRSRGDIAKLMDIRPDKATVLRDGEIVETSPEEVAVGETIVVYPGEKVPLDGIVIEGESSVDLKALTGESLPKDLKVGDKIVSGSVNLTATLTVRTASEYGVSTVKKILDLVENASEKKSHTEAFISRFAKYYTPSVVALALLLAILPGAVTGEWSTWIYRALSFLVVSCPCAIVISVPLSFFAGIGAASRYGILIKGSSYVEQFDKADIFVFDKTGTLTKGAFEVVGVYPEERREEILKAAATAEKGSSHPIAASIAAAYGKEVEDGYRLHNASGMGVEAKKEGETLLAGNEKLMAANGVAFVAPPTAGTAVYVARNGEYLGAIVIADVVKDEAAEAISALGALGAKTVMLTGDSEQVAKDVAERLKVSEYKASLLPQDKVEEVEALLSAKGKRDVLCFVGDGINDAPALMRSDVGVAMGALGSDAAIEASDVTLMRDDLSCLPLAKRIARRTMRVVKENVIFSLGVKLAILILSALGITNMWIAVFGDVGVAMIAILNAMRVNTGYKTKTAGK